MVDREYLGRFVAVLDRWSSKEWFWGLGALADLVLSLGVIRFVGYTEIDWVAYMQEVEGPLLFGIWDYEELKGDTGPLVYPAGFVYFFMGLRALTDGGRNILRAQYIFAFFHAVLVFLVLGAIYFEPRDVAEKNERVPFWIGPLLALSRRVHSIFALRLFNDGVAMMFMYASVFALVRRRNTMGTILFSVAFSIKMNIILFAPGLAILLLESDGLLRSVANAAIFFSIQIILAIPFLQANTMGYLNRAFELGRVFMFKWTVNFKFLPEEVFVSKSLAYGLLLATVSFWIAFGQVHFARFHQGGLLGLVKDSVVDPRRPPPMKPQSEFTRKLHILRTLFTSNFIGIAFARSIHYQFYTWYYHTIPLLAYSYGAGILETLSLTLCIEFCFNVYPATPATSLLLQMCHFVLLVRLWTTDYKREKRKSE